MTRRSTRSLPGALPGKAQDAPFTQRDLVLYAVTVFSWSASWYALKVNSAFSVAPPVTISWRFMLAAALMFFMVAASRARLRFDLTTHCLFALLGIFLFSTNFIFFYYASTLLVSGLLAVVFSLASVVNLLIGAVRGDMAGPRRWFGAALGACGIVVLYWPAMTGSLRQRGAVASAGSWEQGASSVKKAFEWLADAGFSEGGVGLALCLCGTLCFCIGNQISQAMSQRHLPVMSVSAWGMAYGAIWSAILSKAAGYRFVYDTAPAYTGSLLFLTLVSTVLAFWAYLNLVRRIGAGRAAYATVMFPVLALLLSTVLEDYRWTPLALVGVALALAGNLFVLRGQTDSRPSQDLTSKHSRATGSAVDRPD